MSRQVITEYCHRFGITAKSQIDQIASGFDLGAPVYIQWLHPGTRIYQYQRNPSLSGNGNLGRWFALRGASMSSLAIFGGHSGRTQFELEVTQHIDALEGTAGPMAIDWGWAGGGAGGGTQIFLPARHLYALVSRGRA